MKELIALLEEIQAKSARIKAAIALTGKVPPELIRELAELNEISGGLVPMAFDSQDKT